jgi:DNA-binding SARP family transcriptional activator/tetratricopeptide (TPR) repeat protein
MLTIALLGEQRVAADGNVLTDVCSPPTLRLLAYLVLHPGAPQLRRHLAGLFWPDTTDAQARTNLRRELHRLRHALPDADAVLDVDATTLRWREDAAADVDVITFQHSAAEAEAARPSDGSDAFIAAAERAVTVYGGDLLPGLYEDWVQPERDRMRHICVGLLDPLATELQARGRFDLALRHARRRVEVEPLEEAGYRLVMTLEAESGDRAAALRTFHRCASVLERELGATPSPETVAVHDGLVSRPTSADRDGATPTAPPLVGRTEELDALRSMWSQGGSPQPLVALVAGEAGLGKSRVVQEVAAEVEREGGTVARARCFAARGRLALAPVAEWLRVPALRRGIQRLDEAARTEVLRLVPELATEPATAGAGRDVERAPLTDAWHRRRFFDALVEAVHAVGDPVLLVLDDLQWADHETLAWLEVLVNSPSDSPLLVLGTARSEELHDNPELVGLCRRLRARALLRDVELMPLDLHAVTELAAAIGGAPLAAAAVRELHSQTRGFPLFVIESVRWGSVRSVRVEAVLGDRLGKLSPAAAALAQLAATVGRDFSLELLRAATDLDDTALLSAVDELWKRRLLREHSPTTYDFAHDLLRDSVHAQTAPPHRQLLHQRIADALESLHQDNVEAVAAQLAEHREQGGQPGRAVRYHWIAAESATRVFALDDAVDHYERALELLSDLPSGTPRDHQELKLLEACVPALHSLEGYASPTLGRLIERAISLAELLGQDEARVASQLAHMGNLFVVGHIEAALALTNELVTQVEDHPAQTGQICVFHAGALSSTGRLREAVDWFERVESLSEGGERFLYGFRVWVMGRAWRAHPLWLLGRPAEAAGSAEAALALAEEFDHPYTTAVALGYGAITYRLLGEAERAGELARRVRHSCDRHGFAYYGDWGRILEGRTLGGAAGEALIREGFDGLKRANAGTRMPFWLSMLAEVLIASGREREAARNLVQARDWAEEHGDRWWLPEVLRLLASIQGGREAVQLRTKALEVAREQGSRVLELRIVRDVDREGDR